jgi:Tol biopolymer transport system component/DNA-binding winged helix-turn-helix (wHTH) protein
LLAIDERALYCRGNEDSSVTVHVIRFREFELDRDRYELRRNGRAVKLEKMPMELLILLTAKRGHLVTRQEIIECLWGREVYIDSEHGINTVIRKLRQALRDDPEKPRFVETVTGKGYRFVAETIVEEAAAVRIMPLESSARNGSSLQAGSVPAEAGVEGIAEQNVAVEPELIGNHHVARADVISPALAGTADGPETKSAGLVDEVPRGQRRRLPWGGVALAVVVGTVVWYLGRPLPRLRVTEDAQITHDGHRKWLGGTDGSRLYFNELAAITPNQVAVAGGDNTPISIALRGPLICCVSPDGSTLLIQTWDDENIWSAGILGSPLRHLTKVDTPSAAWSPDGKTVVYTTTDGSIFLMRSDGTDARKLASVGGLIQDIAWSPDGSKFRFSKDDVLWEMSSSGSNPHRLLPDWPVSSGHCCGRWTPDGRFFAFLSGVKNLRPNSAFSNSRIWFLDERGGLFRRPSRQPQQLTSGPIGWCCLTPGRDGKTLFATGLTARGELVRFDARTGQLRPYLGGISAEFLSFSMDGKSVVYVSFPDGVLSRASSDGSGRVQLSDPPSYPKGTRWSPDGTRLIFFDLAASNGEEVMYSMPSQGGKPTRVFPEDNGSQEDAGWSPDGSKVVYFAQPETNIRILDVATHRVTSLTGSAGLFSPRWSPDGKSIAALTGDNLALKIFDLATQRWSTLLKHEGSIGFPNWSHDGRYVYILYLNDKPGIYRIRVTGGEAERVVDLTGFHHTGTVTYWFGLDPDDAPLLLRDAGTEDIYALTLEIK